MAIKREMRRRMVRKETKGMGLTHVTTVLKTDPKAKKNMKPNFWLIREQRIRQTSLQKIRRSVLITTEALGKSVWPRQRG